MHTIHRLSQLPHGKASQLSFLYLVSVIRTFLFSFLGLFIPILLFIRFQQDNFETRMIFLLIGLIYLTIGMSHSMSIIPATYFNSRFGIKAGFIIGNFFLLLFLLLSVINTESFFAYNFIFLGIANAFWWVSYHTYFLEVGNKKRFGREISYIKLISIAVGAFAPLIAGAVLFFANSFGLYIFAIVIVLLNSVLSWFIYENKHVGSVTIDDMKSEIQKNRKDFIIFLGSGGQEAIHDVALPLILYSIFQNVLALGGFSTLTMILTLALVYQAGKLTDKISNTMLEKFSATIICGTWIGRILMQTPLGFFIFGLIYDFFSSFFYIPIDANAYKRGLQENPAKYIVLHEFGFQAGHMLGSLVLILVSLFNIDVSFTLIFAVLFMGGSLLISERLRGTPEYAPEVSRDVD